MSNNYIEILTDLLRFDSFTDTGVNLLAEHIIANYLEPAGVLYKRVPSGGRTNLIAVVGGDFSSDFSSALMLSGHIDTVSGNIPVRQQDGKLYGRGAVDMKFFIAIILSLIPYFKTLSYPVLFALTADEETAFTGVSALVDFCQENKIQPKYCIVGEPTDFNLSQNSQGIKAWRTKFHGRAAHSSMPAQGINAIDAAVSFINLVKQNPIINNTPDNSITYNIATISGGIADNIVPDECTLVYSFRFANPSEEDIINQILSDAEQMVRTQTTMPVETTVELYIKAFANTESAFAKKICNGSTRVKIHEFTGATEAGYWQDMSVDTLIFGIGPWAVAHSGDEHVFVKSLSEYADLIQKICDNI